MHSCFRALFFLTALCFATALHALPEGLHYEHLLRDGPLSIHVLEIDPARVKIVPVHAGKEVLSLETVSSLAERFSAFAAINGGFFRSQGTYKGTSAGVLRIGGEWYSSPRFDRGAIGWIQTIDLQSTTVAIDRIALETRLYAGHAVLPIDGINQPPTMSSAILYTSRFHTSTLTSSSFSEMTIDADGRLSEQKGPTSIPSDGYVYSLAPLAIPFMPFLAPSAHGRVQFEPRALNHPDDSGLWSSFPHIVGGTPVLISDGEIVRDFALERLPDSFAKERHPRTAIGISKQGRWFVVVVDGDNQEYSIGMTIDELARFFHELGCRLALNLDGGSSSTLFLAGAVINAPSGTLSKNREDLIGIEKPVSDAILFFPSGDFHDDAGSSRP